MTAADPIRAGITVSTAQRALRDVFRAAGLETPELDASFIMRGLLDLDLTGLVRAAARPLLDGQAEALRAAAARRLAGEPVGRILGRQEFWGLTFDLGPDTLVPRPDTETVVEAALALLDDGGTRDRALVLADLGTGTGAILAALLHELSGAFGVGIDIAPGALRVAQANLVRLGLAGRSALVRGSYADALAPGRFDLVVSNPPYIESGAIAGLMTEVRTHDPALALDGGADGLAAYRALAAPAWTALRPGGALVLEIGHRQGASVAALLATLDFERIAVLPDLAGNDRVVRAFRC
jgi:release factor glutamine methyltransferase